MSAFAAAYPETVASVILYRPVGGAKYRISSHQRFAEHNATQASERYVAICEGMRDALFDRDTAPGATPRR